MASLHELDEEENKHESNSGAAILKDGNSPLPWSQQSFDPDDESLPVVNEVSIGDLFTCFACRIRWTNTRSRH